MPAGMANQEGQVGAYSGKGEILIQALLLETEPSYTQMLSPLFLLEDIALQVVTAAEAFVHLSPAFALLLIDVSGGREEDLVMVVETTRQVAAPVYVFHPREQTIRHLETVVGTELVWLPADLPIIRMRDLLHLLKITHDDLQAENTLGRLTRREQEIWNLMVEGLSYRDIGTTLSISKSAVATMAGRMMRKLEVNDRKQLVKSADSPRSVLHLMGDAPPEKRTTKRMKT